MVSLKYGSRLRIDYHGFLLHKLFLNHNLIKNVPLNLCSLQDLSSVLKSISEALSTTVTLPPCGSKKLHLRLSILPDQDIKIKQDHDKVQKKALAAIEDSKDTKETKEDSKQTAEQTTTSPVLAGNNITHVHRRHHHGHRVRSSKRHSRSHVANHADAVNLDVRSPDKRHSRARWVSMMIVVTLSASVQWCHSVLH